MSKARGSAPTSTTLASRRVLRVAAGEDQFATLDPEERTAAHALVDARIAGRAATERLGPSARASGQRTVSLDEDGHLVEIGPDGYRRLL